MSVQAMQWVSEVTAGKSSYKAVLVALANFHHQTRDICDPSIATLAAFTELNRKTVIAALKSLEEGGFISTRKRYGASTTYRLNFEVTSTKNGTGKRRDTSTNFGTASGSTDDQKPVPNLGPVPKTVPVPKTDTNQYQKRPQPVPNLGHKQEEQDKQGNNPPIVPPVIELPTNRFNTNGETVPITREQVSEFSSLYPAVDIEGQLRAMRGWLDSNPTKRKTSRGMPRFINSWLARRQDQGGDRHGVPQGSSTPGNTTQGQPGGGPPRGPGQRETPADRVRRARYGGQSSA